MILEALHFALAYIGDAVLLVWKYLGGLSHALSGIRSRLFLGSAETSADEQMLQESIFKTYLKY